VHISFNDSPFQEINARMGQQILASNFIIQLQTVYMKNNNSSAITENKAQTGKAIKKELPVKNAMTDKAKNIATQTPGLNQANTKRDDLFPSDGDNMTQ